MAKMFQIIENVVTYDTHIAGGKLPKGYEANIRVEMDCDGATHAQLLTVVCTTSARVTLSKDLRESSTPEILDKYNRDIHGADAPLYKAKLTDIISGASSISKVDIMMSMTKDEFVSTLMMQFGQNEAQATKIYNNKHAKK